MRSGLPKDDLVTGEAVVVALPFAGLAIRALSGAVDMVVHLLLTVGLTFGIVRVAGGLDEALVTSFSLLITVFCLLGFPCIVLARRALNDSLFCSCLPRFCQMAVP